MATLSQPSFRPNRWVIVALVSLAIWLGGSIVVDMVMMPSLYLTGMMTQPDFASAGYLMFWIFNRVELLMAAVVVTSMLLLTRLQVIQATTRQWAIALASVLVSICLLETYVFSPAMSQLGLNLNLFAPATVPDAMTAMHQGYFVLEVLKFAAGGVLLALCYNISHRTPSWMPEAIATDDSQ
ncbi:MAG: DUF4149 domain-containing protein [Leptolyngbya sp. DLM2.Bin15]|nr:MAG: DUF4149 domain-containing protein [Leptolyngbya sp. DLM2.Bin15]